MAALILLGVIVALGIASALGITPDTRDRDFGLGGLVGRPNRSELSRPDLSRSRRR